MNSIGLTDEQIRRGLIAQGVPPEKAARAAMSPTSEHLSTALAAAPAGPVTLVLPWSCLISDNRHRGPVSSRTDAAAYKLARTRAHDLAREQWGSASVFTGPVSVGLVFTPPRLGKPDPVNLLKCLLDALVGVCYADDVQIYRLAVDRLAPSIDRPHVTITVEEIAP